MQTIAAAFVKAKRAFGPALKDKTNPAFRSKYADLGACIDSVEQALLDNGIAFIQETFEDATGVTVETVFIHESGESMRCGKLHLPAAKQDPQGYGSALTYARRYSLSAACGIAPEDDDGNAAAKALKAAQTAQTQPERLSDRVPNFPKVADLVMGDNDALLPEVKLEMDELAAQIKEQFPTAGPKRCAERIKLEKLDAIQELYLSNLLPTPMRNAIKTASHALNQKATA